jgi:hypothetical protein
MKGQKHGKKRAWIKPEIKVLVRSQTEETVLNGCKTYDQPGGPGSPPCHSGSWHRCSVDSTS